MCLLCVCCVFASSHEMMENVCVDLCVWPLASDMCVVLWSCSSNSLRILQLAFNTCDLEPWIRRMTKVLLLWLERKGLELEGLELEGLERSKGLELEGLERKDLEL